MPDANFAEAVKKAQAGERVTTTPRTIVGWWGRSRRGRNIVEKIRKQMKRKKVTTEPDFEAVWIDDPVYLVTAKEDGAKRGTEQAAKPATEAAALPSLEPVEPAHRISRLEAASRAPEAVSPGDSREKAVTLMLQRGFSQVPVMPNKGTVKGMVSWRSIGQSLHFGAKCKTVDDCMEQAREVPETASLFEAVKVVTVYDAVLVRSMNGAITGIVTHADIGRQFGELVEPFLLIEDIEEVLRALIDRAFSAKELKNVARNDEQDHSRKVETVQDLTFGEYLRLIENREHWAQLKLPLDRKEVIKRLERVREIRNDVMHFDPDPLDDESLELLRFSARFFAKVHELMR